MQQRWWKLRTWLWFRRFTRCARCRRFVTWRRAGTLFSEAFPPRGLYLKPRKPRVRALCRSCSYAYRRADA